MVRFHEAATPLTQRRFVGAVGGAMYGLEMSVERQGSDALKLRTPVPGTAACWSRRGRSGRAVCVHGWIDGRSDCRTGALAQVEWVILPRLSASAISLL